MTDMLRIAEEAAEQAKFSLGSIDLNTIGFTLINTLIIVLLYFFFLHKPVCKILDERAKTVNKDMDDAQKAKDFIDNLELFSLLANVADVKSLVIHPATTTHSQCTEEELLDQGIKPNTIRLSIGTENIDDIIQDLDEAFKAIQ